MANTKSAKKRVLQNEKRRKRNMSLRSRFRTYVKNVLKAIQQQDKELANSAFKAAVPIIDGMVTKGLIHKNKAARHKSRLNAKLKVLNISA